MTWVRISDDFYDHKKFAATTALGWALWLGGLAYCNRNLTDGFIPASRARGLVNFERPGHYELAVVNGMSGDNATAEHAIDELLEVGLWEESDGGYTVHDYADYQPTSEQVNHVSTVRAAAGQRGAAAKWGNRDASANGETDWHADGKPMANARQTDGKVMPHPPTPVKDKPPPTPPVDDLRSALPESGGVATHRGSGGNSLDRLTKATDRLIRLCSARNRELVKAESVALVSWAAALDVKVLEEEIALAEGLTKRPALPRFLAKPLQRRAAAALVPLPDFQTAKKGTNQ